MGYTLLTTHYAGHDRTLNRIHIKDHGISVLSYRYNEPSMNASKWVERIVGEKAVYQKALYWQNKTFTAHDNFKLHQPNPNFIHTAPAECSFELLGYARVGDDHPFHKADRVSLITGNATLSLPQADVTWNCSYRSYTESWRINDQYWPVFFYCPAPQSFDCTNLKSKIAPHGKRPTGHLTMQLTNKTWSAPFSANDYVSKMRSKNLNEGKESSPGGIAACLILPYVSSNDVKADINNIILYEWIRHHTSLEIKVIIFDRGGARAHAVYNNTYGKTQGNINFDRVSYYPHTIASLFEKNLTSYTYDNNESGNSREKSSSWDRLHRSDSDKTNTLSYCRFEASAVYGIENVMVMDSDEFLLCPEAAPSYAAQQTWLNYHLTKYKSENAEEIVFLPIITALKTEGGKYKTAIECMMDKTSNGESMYECFAASEYIHDTFWMGKSMSLGHNCPLTDFHHTCNGNNDCVCTSVQPNKCNIMHLTLHEKIYEKVKFSNETIKEYESRQSELWYMSHRKSPHYVG